MTELCKFCVIFQRLYIDNIIKASKNIGVFFFFGWCLFSFGHIYSDLKNAEEDRNRLINFSKPRGIIVKDELVYTVFGACPYILKKLNSPQKIDRFKTHVDWYMIDAWSRVAIVARLFSQFTNSDQRPWIDTLYMFLTLHGISVCEIDDETPFLPGCPMGLPNKLFLSKKLISLALNV